jgi:hypothetical protein
MPHSVLRKVLSYRMDQSWYYYLARKLRHQWCSGAEGESGVSQQPLVGSYPNFKLMLIGQLQSVQKSQMKTSYNGRRHQNLKIAISQQPLVGSYPNFKLKIREPNQNQQKPQMRTTFIRRQPQNNKVEYHSNHWSDLSKILNVSSEDQTKVYRNLK